MAWTQSGVPKGRWEGIGREVEGNTMRISSQLNQIYKLSKNVVGDNSSRSFSQC